MRICLVVISTIFLISSCATTDPLDGQIAVAAKSVNLVRPNSPDWCNAAANCKYIGELYCTEARTECNKRILVDTVRYGGDTLVIQAAGILKGYAFGYDEETDYYRIYGQAYNCSDKHTQLHTEYTSRNKLATVSEVRFTVASYASQCKTMTNCEKIKYQSCSSIRTDPFKLCVEKFNRNYKRNPAAFNEMVASKELFNNAASYRIFVDLYKCN